MQMTNSPSFILKDYTVFNCDFYKDVNKFLDLQLTEKEVQNHIDKISGENPLTEEQIKAGELTLKERLNALIDRIEFIGHLELVSDLAVKSNFVFLGQEVRGIHWDIRSLRLYLALTCIDIFCEQGDHREHFETVFSQVSNRTKKIIDNSLFLTKPDGTKCTQREIGLFFSNVRNYYTHSGKRFHIMEECPLSQENLFMSGSKKNKAVQCLVIADGTSLVDLLIGIAIDTAKRRFGWNTE